MFTTLPAVFPLGEIDFGGLNYRLIMYLLAAGSFVIGACVGSYLNVCIYRIPLGQSTAFPRRSYCFSCGSTILAAHNIPLISYWRLGGLCPQCGSLFSSRYFLIELLTALLFLLAFWRYGLTPAVFAYWIFIGLMLVAMFTDIDNWIIPDRISIGGFVAGVLLAPLALIDASHVLVVNPYNSALGALAGLLELAERPNYAWISWLTAEHAWAPPANALAGAAFGYSILITVRVAGQLLTGREAMGLGDVKLFACLGAFLGWLNSLYVLMLASVLGSVFGIAQIVQEKIFCARQAEPGEELAAVQKPLHPLPFGPHIAVAAIIVLLYQRDIPAAFSWFSRIMLPLQEWISGRF